MFDFLQTRISLALLLLSAFLGTSAFAQTSAVELLGTVPASQVKDGLGFNLDPGEDWEWQAAAAAGATHARIQCSWSIVEQQTAPPENAPASTRYVEDPGCAAGFASAKKYGIHPTVVAAYGAPYHPILTVTVPEGAPAGATSFEIEYAQGFGGDTLANLKFPYDYICPLAPTTNTCSSQFSSAHSYQGTLIAAVAPIDSTHAKVSLASALTRALPASTTPYLVSEILYPSAATESATDPSIVAYGDYVEFLANDMASYGITGDIEIWNEPPWANDPWDYRAGLYDAGLYTGSSQSWANFGFVTNLMKRTFPAGITATWNGTSGTGWNSLLGPRLLSYTGETLPEPSSVVTKESFHPYGGPYANPEEMMWVTSCLQGTAGATTSPADNPMANGMNCYLPGVSDTANMLQAVGWDMKQKLISPSYGVGHEITETNDLPPTAGLRIQQSKAVMRQFIGFQADGLTPIEFFKMYDATDIADPNFSFVEQVGTTSTYTANPDYTALAEFMQDILPISNDPVVSYTAADLPSVLSYTGSYALGTANFVGARDGGKSNSDAYVVWQVSACTTTKECWYNLPSPSPAPVTVNVPAGMKVDAVVDTVTRGSVAYSTSGDKLTFDVSDDPIEVLLDPTSYAATGSSSSASGLTVTTLTLRASSTTSTYGQGVTLTATVTPYSSKGHSNSGDAISFFSGSTLLGTAPLSSGLATLTTSALPAGTHILSASYAGDASFFASSGAASITISQATPTMALAAIASKVTTSAAFTEAATSTSPATVHFKIVSGPARIATDSGGGVATVQVMGAGNVVLEAYQGASGNYAAGSVQTSFTVQAAQASDLALSIPTQTYGTAPIAVSATSKSSAPITYTLVSGPATISGNTITLTGAGTVSVQANQPIGGIYLAAQVRATFTVQGKAPTITMPAIASKVSTSAPFTVTASSTSPGAMRYAVLSGPARIAGVTDGVATVQLMGAGSVVLEAYQGTSGNYAAGSVQTSFTVQAAQASDLALSIPTQTYGTAPIAVSATSKSSAPITYTLVSGPATISGNTITLTGAGTVSVQANQPIGGIYLAAQVRATFTVQGKAPTITMPAIASKVSTSAPFTVTASSTSPGAMRYAVLSGPARIAGVTDGVATVQLMGAGSVVLEAYQGTSGNYAAGSVQTSFRVE